MSAHSTMRGMFIFALLLMALPAVSAAGTQAKSAQTHKTTVHRKASSSSRHTAKAGTRKASASKTHTRSKASFHWTPSQSTKHTTSHRATRTRTRETAYTPERTAVREANPAAISPNYEAGYRKGFEEGRAAALRELKSEANVKLTGRGSEPMRAGGNPDTDEKTSAAERATEGGEAQTDAEAQADAGAQAPALTETTEAAAPRTSPITEMATLDMSSAGIRQALRGTLASLERQNARTEADGLERIENEADLSNRIAQKLLVPLPASAALTVNSGLPDHNRYCRPWTARFLADLARAHRAAFHRPLQVNSAVRTVEYQKRLMQTNGNAADAEGDIVSPHLTGATIDIAKAGLSREELAWMRQVLLGLQKAGKIDVEEEFRQACFHITVYKSYVSAGAAHRAARKAAQEAANPAMRDADTRHKAAPPATQRRGSHLPADLATGIFSVPGR